MVGETYTTSVQGTHCGAPFSVSFAYRQIAAVATNGLALAQAFWGDGGPGALWMQISSDKLIAQCMSWSSPTDVGAALLEDRIGERDSAAMPPVCAVLYHLRPLTPWPGSLVNKPKYDVGRFFLPGLAVEDVTEYHLRRQSHAAFRTFGDSLLNLEVTGVDTFRLVAFPEFVPPPGGEYGVRSCRPDILIRRIKTRRPNTCELYAGAGQTGGRPTIPLP